MKKLLPLMTLGCILAVIVAHCQTGVVDLSSNALKGTNYSVQTNDLNAIISLWHSETPILPSPTMKPYSVLQDGQQQVYIEPCIQWSNIVAEIVWKGRTNEFVIESNAVKVVNRSYVLENVKRYLQ
jgi:hypothetical protein